MTMMVDTRRSSAIKAWTMTVPLCVGVLLGAGAFLADQAPEPFAAAIQPILSSASVWGTGALVVGYLARSRMRASLGATATLVAAVSVYYLLHLFIGRRWQLGSLEDGSPSGAAGLASTLRATLLWLVIAVLVGSIVGYVGYSIQSASPRRRSLSGGVIVGVLSGEGLRMLLAELFVSQVPPRLGIIVQACLCLVVVWSGTVLLLTRQRRQTVWSTFLSFAVPSVVLSTVVWLFLQSIRTSML